MGKAAGRSSDRCVPGTTVGWSLLQARPLALVELLTALVTSSLDRAGRRTHVGVNRGIFGLLLWGALRLRCGLTSAQTLPDPLLVDRYLGHGTVLLSAAAGTQEHPGEGTAKKASLP
jgi:hypothetical protein